MLMPPESKQTPLPTIAQATVAAGLPAGQLDGDQARRMGRALADAEEQPHPELLHVVGLQDLDGAAVGLELLRDLRHLLGVQVIRGPIRQVAAEFDPLADVRATIDSLLRGPAQEQHLVHRPLHRVGVADASVDRRGPIRARHGTGRRGRPGVVVLAIAQPQRQRSRTPAVEPPRGDGGQAASTEGATAARAGVEQQQPADRQVAGVDQRGGMLERIELAPLDRGADRASRGGVQLGEVAAQVGVLAVDRHRQHVGGDGGGKVGGRAQAHA